MIDCSVIWDLLPQYADGLAGRQTRALVEAHLAGCETCRARLARMQAQLADEARADADYGRTLKRQMRRMRRRTRLWLLAAAVLGAALCFAFLWSRGVFFLVDRQTSPDGSVTTTVYSRDVTGLFPREGACTLRDSGATQGTVLLNGSFDGLWWSPDSRFQVFSSVDDQGIQLWLHDYDSSSSGNLDAWVAMAAQTDSWFPDAPRSEMEWPDVEYRFLQWGEDSASMLLRYDYVDTGGVDRAGYVWYNLNTGDLSGQMPLETAAAVGTVTATGVHQDGTPFATMVLDALDADGNEVEFVFSITDATALRGLTAPAEGDRLQVVYRPDPSAYDLPAVSVTALP